MQKILLLGFLSLISSSVFSMDVDAPVDDDAPAPPTTTRRSAMPEELTALPEQLNAFQAGQPEIIGLHFQNLRLNDDRMIAKLQRYIDEGRNHHVKSIDLRNNPITQRTIDFIRSRFMNATIKFMKGSKLIEDEAEPILLRADLLRDSKTPEFEAHRHHFEGRSKMTTANFYLDAMKIVQGDDLDRFRYLLNHYLRLIKLAEYQANCEKSWSPELTELMGKAYQEIVINFSHLLRTSDLVYYMRRAETFLFQAGSQEALNMVAIMFRHVGQSSRFFNMIEVLAQGDDTAQYRAAHFCWWFLSSDFAFISFEQLPEMSRELEEQFDHMAQSQPTNYRQAVQTFLRLAYERGAKEQSIIQYLAAWHKARHPNAHHRLVRKAGKKRWIQSNAQSSSGS